MNRTVITAANTLNQLQKQLDIIGTNLANVDTNGYKRRETNFTELMNQHYDHLLNTRLEAGRLTPNGIRMGTGAKLAQSQMVSIQGSIQTTGRLLDFALAKENQFFKVLVQEDGQGQVHYTRNGAFYLTPINENESMLVNGDGYPVLDDRNQMITFNKDDSQTISLVSGGALSADDGEPVNLGIVHVDYPQFLQQKGGNLLSLPADMDSPDDFVVRELTGIQRQEIGLQQKALEKSNVDTAKEMTDMMNVQRSYQFQSRAITLSDQMMGLINGIR
ncbi:MAG TPA: flagellar hook-basal body protein [Chondromyces sp.]|nr:flagellar hook-basal body protein [Chondromyces sp.]